VRRAPGAPSIEWTVSDAPGGATVHIAGPQGDTASADAAAGTPGLPICPAGWNADVCRGVQAGSYPYDVELRSGATVLDRATVVLVVP
jgi:hypothetical protein